MRRRMQQLFYHCRCRTIIVQQVALFTLVIYCIIILQSYAAFPISQYLQTSLVSSHLSHTASRHSSTKRCFIHSLCLLLVTEEFLTEQSRPRCRKQKDGLKKKKNMDREIVKRRRGGSEEDMFSFSPLSPLFLGWSVSLTPSVISLASL